MNIKNCNEPVSEKVRSIINERGLKQSKIAEQAGYTSQSFNAMLQGRKVIKVNDIERIAKALNVTANDLFAKPPNKGA